MVKQHKKKDLRRKQIIEAAIEVFGNNSFKEASISEIAQRAKIAEGTIYQYFKNKEDLFFSIPAEMIEEFWDELDLHLQGIHDSFNKMSKFVWFYLYHFKMNPAYARSMMLEMRVSKNFSKSKTHDKVVWIYERVLEIIKEGQEEGLIRKDVEGYAIREMLMGMLEARLTRWLLKDEKFDLMENYGEICDLIFNGIKSSAASNWGSSPQSMKLLNIAN
ncbi:transcriptional regulator, TetR family [Syntrophus gentianae]|uniref:Transcriptional regulator, TetR family n=1 Tax=Syntrophus gentianae TaxID=43775 RepID=A0A1H7X679_9BACT|nr:TetR/AcrR family transcriptional regulator [Syntrophus gentianae]SEM29336.1 transcriptional regulator, TetR family [Syntrophus gentianae]